MVPGLSVLRMSLPFPFTLPEAQRHGTQHGSWPPLPAPPSWFIVQSLRVRRLNASSRTSCTESAVAHFAGIFRKSHSRGFGREQAIRKGLVLGVDGGDESLSQRGQLRALRRVVSASGQ